ncbi:MAG: hypothetical protein K1X89_12690 [Myxococcaceae bacterium]|nr:hypothetical protein [Myxococcaceae bacterium]
MDRRTLNRSLLLGLAAALTTEALAGPRRRRIRRRVRRRIRRRIRRHVLWRTVAGRRLLVVPVAVAVGWELAVDQRVVVVREVRAETVVVADLKTSATEELPAVREDDAENAKELPGTVLAEGDTTTPSRETEEEVEEEVDG